MPVTASALPPSATEPRCGNTQAARHAAGAVAHKCRLAIAIAAAESGFSIEILLSRSRSSAPVALARQLAMYLAHVGLGLSQADVALAFRRDRSTVAHACRRVEDLRDGAPFDDRVGRMEASLRWATEA